MAHGDDRASGLSPSAQRTLGRQLAEQADPLPWAPVEFEIALRMGLARKPVNAWKPLIDSLVAILGRAPGKTEFDIEDGRIVSLVIHQDIDPSLEHAVSARLWWRTAEPAHSDGPPLSYRVEELDTPVAPATSSQRVRDVGAASRRDLLTADFDVIATLDQLREIQAKGQGFIAITDDANPPKLHRAGCPAIQEDNFARKVIQNKMRTGKYFYLADSAHARARWSKLREHDCVV